MLIAYYWREWLRLIRGLVTSLISRRIQTPDQRLAWLIVIATIPVGVAGLALEHTFRVLFARPEAAALFLMVNGGILVLGERYRRRAGPAAAPGGDAAATAAGPAGTTAPVRPASAAPASPPSPQPRTRPAPKPPGRHHRAREPCKRRNRRGRRRDRECPQRRNRRGRRRCVREPR